MKNRTRASYFFLIFPLVVACTNENNQVEVEMIYFPNIINYSAPPPPEMFRNSMPSFLQDTIIGVDKSIIDRLIYDISIGPIYDGNDYLPQAEIRFFYDGDSITLYTNRTPTVYRCHNVYEAHDFINHLNQRVWPEEIHIQNW